MQLPTIKTVLAAVDFSPWTAPVLRAAAHLADQYGARLSALYSELFLPPPYFTEHELGAISALLDTQRRAAGQHLAGVVGEVLPDRQVKVLLEDQLPVEGILHGARAQQAGLIVLGAQHRPLLEATFFGTTSVRLMRHAPTAVLTVVRPPS